MPKIYNKFLKGYALKNPIKFSLLLVFFLIPFATTAQDTITFYPGQSTLISSVSNDFTYQDRNIIINKLPLGINPNSIQIFSPKINNWLYSYDLENNQAFFNKISGKTIELNNKGKKVKMKFIKKQENSLYFQKDNTLHINPEGEITIPSSQKLTIEPAIVLNTPITDADSISYSYFVTSLKSSIQYQAEFDRKNKKLSLTPFLHINNKSGVSFNNAKINMISGSPKFQENRQKNSLLRSASIAPETQIEKKDEYYKYQLSQKYSLKNNCLTALPLFPALELKTTLKYCYEAPPVYKSDKKTSADKIDLVLTFTNNSGLPLPAGETYLFHKGDFIGSDYLESTPKGEKRSLRYGKAFSLKAKKMLIDTKRIHDNKVQQESYKIYLTNLKSTEVNIEVIDFIPGRNWEITKSSFAYNKISNNKVKFVVKVPPSKTEELKYTVERKRR
ncbi:DUF4139 domain-containing protein [Candidatus Margulisiibacteriota bacterium]